MFLNKSFPYTTSSKIHIVIGVTLGVLILFILFFLEPFGSGSSDFPFKTLYFMVYGLITFAVYFITHLGSVIFYKKIQAWKLFNEITFCLVFLTMAVIVAFFYTEILINKNTGRLNFSHFLGWSEAILLGFGILVIIPAIILRNQYGHAPSKNNLKSSKDVLINTQEIRISGSLKKDSLRVSEANLVYIKSENNYVRIFYFEKSLLKEKLLRSTLTQIKKQLPSFIKVHRSYIVNPKFILSLKGNKQNAKVYLKKIDHSLPISKPFFESLNELFINHK